MAYQSAIAAAETYASKPGNQEHEWLYWKPFDQTPGNPQYYRLIPLREERTGASGTVSQAYMSALNLPRNEEKRRWLAELKAKPAKN